MVQLSHLYMTTWKTIVLIIWIFVSKVMILLFNMLSRFGIGFLPRSKYLLIPWLQSLLQWFWSSRNKVCHCFHCFPIYLPWSNGTRCHDISFFWMLSSKPAFSLSSFTLIKRLLIKVEEENEKAFLKLNIQKSKIMASCPITSWQIGKSGYSDRFYFLGLQNHCGHDCSHKIKRCLLLGRKAMTNLTAY